MPNPSLITYLRTHPPTVHCSCEFHCYGSDITTSFPANGVFTADQRIVYDAVWAAVQAVETAMKPGVVWTDMHSLAYRTVLTHLKAAGLIV